MDTGESRSLTGGAVLRRARPGDENGILSCVHGLAEPSIRFYRSIGAVGMDEWKIQRLSGDALTRLAAS